MKHLLILSLYSTLVLSGYAQPSVKSATKKFPIGVFDSGTGGLTVLEAMLTLDAFNNETGKP
ncbi:hypothetical protein V3478_33485, partial [Pseudomonas aeruginosa]|uniref:hypothetical protein n=1 Tax=Pseudomonas aeruginosa TaxID=287 RepID=UPI002F937C4C